VLLWSTFEVACSSSSMVLWSQRFHRCVKIKWSCASPRELYNIKQNNAASKFLKWRVLTRFLAASRPSHWGDVFIVFRHSENVSPKFVFDDFGSNVSITRKSSANHIAVGLKSNPTFTCRFARSIHNRRNNESQMAKCPMCFWHNQKSGLKSQLTHLSRI